MRKTFFEKCIAVHLFGIALAILLLLPAISSLRANPTQDKPISGIVTSASDGEPLIGVSVLVKGTTNGIVTDLDGRYSLRVDQGQTLVFSYIGCITQEIKYAGQATLNVILKEDTEVLDEVVVVGYGVQKKKLITGATVQVKGDNLQKMNTTNPLQALQGQTPGVSIASTSGQPGSDMKVTIRGLGTVGKSGPLYIIDGVEGDISVLNAANIESIDVLKDAASAAIYGAQSANGVVLVTTKSGKEGKAQVTFDGYYGVQDVARKAKMLNSTQYMAIMNEQALNSGSSVFDFSQEARPGIYNTDGTVINTDWIDQMFKNNAKTQSYTLGISGGSSTSTYAISLGYLAQEGIVGGKDVSDYERYNFRVNTEHKLYKDVLKVGQHTSFVYTKNTGISVGNQYSNTLRGAFSTSPLSPVYSDNNTYDSPYNDTSNSDWYNGDGNPYGSMMTNTNNLSDNQKFVADVYAELQPIKNLKIRSVFGFNYYSSEYRSYSPLYHLSVFSYNDTHTSVSQNMSKGHTMTWTNTASYDFTVGDHAINALIGMEAQRYQGTYLSASNWDLKSIFSDWQHAYIDNTENTDSDGKDLSGKPEENYRRVSYFGRVGYNYKEKYLFNATLRADASSKFSKGNRWGYFPSVSAGWVLTNEEFMKPVTDFMDYLKLRASWGQVGNQNIPNFQYSAPITTSTTNYIFGTEGLGADYNQWGAYPSRLANSNIKWETSEQVNIGVDARFLGKLNANVDFYIKTTKDWLVEAPILATVGTGAPYINGGDVKNTGLELALTWNDHIGKFNYNVGVNGAYNKNKVGKIPTEDGIIHGLTNMLYDNSEEFYRAQNGHAIGYYWGYKTDGLFQNTQEIADWKDAGNGILQSNVKPGDVRYVDQDHNGVIDENDKVDLGNGMPDFTYGFNFGFDYKGFDFSLNANGMIGNKIVQSYRNHGGNSKSNYTTAILARWTGEGTSNRIPRVTETNINWQFSDLYVHDGDFLRISNITLGYDFSKLISLKYISQVRLYAQVQNAFTFTKYNGMDPEIGYGTEDDGWVSGIDLGYYPRPVTFLIGANIKF
ncbi:TonB-dependent receptor [uncultured Bacteroides sp.]|uniref:SusC/RagA family TonB-linked outer membrane protein n=1 Tax=uncultured Bacteroides sp. TaxID=162156 RepID=UPI002AA764E9|nr:TonB-dependent receptor [uncultured Bacteroides sp.]